MVGVSYFEHDLAQQIGRERRELARLAHTSAAGGETRRDLPREQVERQVPRRDETRDADGHLGGVGDGVEMHHVGRLVLVHEQAGGEEAKVVGRARYLHARRQPQRFALVRALGARQLARARLYLVGDLVQDARSLRNGRLRPFLKGRVRRLDRAVGLFLAAVRHQTQQLARARVMALDVVLARQKHVIDEVRYSNGLHFFFYLLLFCVVVHL